MLIYGSKGTPMKSSVPSKNSTCPHCKAKDSLTYQITCNYVHLYWIPVFTYGKEGTLNCSECDQTVSPYKMPKTTRDEFEKVKKSVWPPIWHFSGIAVIALLFYFVSLDNEQQLKNNPIYLANPVVGDVYKLEIQPMKYTTMKVTQINQDTILVIPNDYVIARKSKLYKIDKESNYSKEMTYALTKEELMNMYEEKKIFEVER